MDDVVQMLVAVGGLFVLVGFVADSVSSAAVRRKIAGKELSPEQIEGLLRRRVSPEAALKWALLAISVGLGLVVHQFLPQTLQDEPFTIGLVLILAGGALLLYRRMVRQ